MSSNSPFYCSPGEAAALTGDTLEHVIQRVSFCRGEPLRRLPLYALLKKSYEVIWVVIPSEKDPNYSGPEEGKASLFPGQRLEIDHEQSNLLAASPEETFLVRVLRAPAEGLGINKRIPGRAALVIKEGISVNFSQCWIAERDLFGAECQPKTKPKRRDEQIAGADVTVLAKKANRAKNEKLNPAREYAVEQVRLGNYPSINAAADALYERCNQIAIDAGTNLSKTEFRSTFRKWLPADLIDKLKVKKK